MARSGSTGSRLELGTVVSRVETQAMAATLTSWSPGSSRQVLRISVMTGTA